MAPARTAKEQGIPMQIPRAGKTSNPLPCVASEFLHPLPPTIRTQQAPTSRVAAQLTLSLAALNIALLVFPTLSTWMTPKRWETRFTIDLRRLGAPGGSLRDASPGPELDEREFLRVTVLGADQAKEERIGLATNLGAAHFGPEPTL